MGFLFYTFTVEPVLHLNWQQQQQQLDEVLNLKGINKSLETIQFLVSFISKSPEIKHWNPSVATASIYNLVNSQNGSIQFLI